MDDKKRFIVLTESQANYVKRALRQYFIDRKKGDAILQIICDAPEIIEDLPEYGEALCGVGFPHN